MRAQIEPNFALAKERYYEILREILVYMDHCRKNGDEGRVKRRELEEKLHKISAKGKHEFEISDCWEWEGAENLAFDIALPKPQVVSDITKDELKEIIELMSGFREAKFDDEFLNAFYQRTISGKYFHDFLKLNFKDTYDFKLFTRQKINGEFIELSADEITEILWGKR